MTARRCTVGELRQQSSLQPSDTSVVLVPTDDGDEGLVAVLRNLVVVRCYPDTTDQRGDWGATFKLEVRRREPTDSGP